MPLTKLFYMLVLGLHSLPSLANLSTPSHKPDNGTIISTAHGQIRGYIRNGALEFRGIPFAMPIVGDKRWTPPQPSQPWQGVLDAMRFKPACPQPSRFKLTEASDQEDCLYLNVTVPLHRSQSDTHKLPVIVIIHGGAFVGGSSSLYRLDRLANKTDAVVVSFNYRLGALGFLAHPALDPDHNAFWGMEDQRLALKWVQQNIAAFGGDPQNVTLMGESAGAISVCMHLSMPKESTGLFHKAIAISHACIHPLPDQDQGNAFGLKIATSLGCDQLSTAQDCLRQVDINQLLKAGDNLPISQPMPFSPVLGSLALPADTANAFQTGRFLHVPMIMGGTRDELRVYVGYEIQAGKTFTPANYIQSLERFYGDRAAEVARAYPLSSFSSAGAAIGTAVSNFMPAFGVNHCLMIETAKLASRRVPVYFMDFADRTTPKRGVIIPVDPDPGIEIGASHSTVMNYVFPGFSNTNDMFAPDLSAESKKSADLMLAYFKQFIRAGDPNDGQRPRWVRFGEDDEAMRFDEKGAHLFDPAKEYQCRFWRELYPEYFKN